MPRIVYPEMQFRSGKTLSVIFQTVYKCIIPSNRFRIFAKHSDFTFGFSLNIASYIQTLCGPLLDCGTRHHNRIVFNTKRNPYMEKRPYMLCRTLCLCLIGAGAFNPLRAQQPAPRPVYRTEGAVVGYRPACRYLRSFPKKITDLFRIHRLARCGCPFPNVPFGKGTACRTVLGRGLVPAVLPLL